MTGTFTSQSEEELIALGAQFATTLKSGDIVLLTGELGAGKTTFTKGVAAYFGIDRAPSPTFTLMNVFPTKHKHIKEFVHIDTYRLESITEVLGTGMQDYIGQSGTVSLIEWPELVAPLLKEKKSISITISSEGDGRSITIS
ncbi:MAG: tRNA (adenosine(37)-N6)-threonylcarbamoyltransferase complex ATPase subunit type 1 TsaE [Candidatus Magasanikbacteria bacterium]|jgi:tRNA threonylcarbamoyladenosine biosynthesis protein TsaE|nr:tRNA (adenosine(37)-N6)-threonylcarbamoyltransferase complex ATPase subunit type 1 TsaE [Candidatus Magasanikbacteria bacterium]